MKVVGLAGWSGSGKTVLLTRLIPHFRAQGISVSTIKHAHHAFDVDVPGKDSYRHREAGAQEVLISSGRRFALMHELREEPEWPLVELLVKLSPVDLVLVEGFKRDAHPKLEVWRSEVGKPALWREDSHIVAVASDMSWPDLDRPHAHIDDIADIADLLLGHALSIDELIVQLRA